MKLHACAHLLASPLYALTLGIVLSTVAFALTDDPLFRTLSARYGLPFLFSSAALLIVFHEAQDRRGVVEFLRFLQMMAAFLVFTLGLCLHNALAAFAGWIGQPSEFVRTPKDSIVGGTGRWAATDYASRKVATVVWLEMAMLAVRGRNRGRLAAP